jgi:hypothetical protein
MLRPRDPFSAAEESQLGSRLPAPCRPRTEIHWTRHFPDTILTETPQPSHRLPGPMRGGGLPSLPFPVQDGPAKEEP